MKILIKNGKWNVNFGQVNLEIKVKYDRSKKLFNLEFNSENEIIKIKSNNIDKTLAFLENKINNSGKVA